VVDASAGDGGGVVRGCRRRWRRVMLGCGCGSDNGGGMCCEAEAVLEAPKLRYYCAYQLIYFNSYCAIMTLKRKAIK